MELKPLPYKDAIDFWRDKVKLSPKEFYALSAEARAKAFTVSGMARESEIADIFSAIDKAIAEGISFSQFKKEIGDIVARKGWTGKRAWRIETIFRSNVQSAYNAGRYKQMTDEAVVKALPYWMYDAVNDSRTRPLHRAMDGRVFRADDPIWDTWFPPNGFNCRCSTVALTEHDMKRLGKTVEDGARVNGKPIELVDANGNPTGMVQNLLPDPDWDFNPGKVNWGDQFLKRVMKEKPYFKPFGGKSYHDYHLPNANKLPVHPLPTALWPKNLTNEEAKKRFINLFGEEKHLTDPTGSKILINSTLFEYLIQKPSRRFQYVPLIEDLIEHPQEIWLRSMKDDTGKVRLRRLYLKKYEGKKNNLIIVMDVEKTMWTGWTFFFSPKENYLNNSRTGYLIWAKK